jgi:hypothetical protein
VEAQIQHVNTPELKQMLALAKTISYNRAERSLHFFFFDRATARKYQTTMVPFRKKIYRLINVHPVDTGTVGQRQFGRDGTRLESTRQYAIDIHYSRTIRTGGHGCLHTRIPIIDGVENNDENGGMSGFPERDRTDHVVREVACPSAPKHAQATLMLTVRNTRAPHREVSV